MRRISTKYALVTIFILMFFFLSCESSDIKGKIVIEYPGEWWAMIEVDQTSTRVTGEGAEELEYDNPDYLKVTATKLDLSDDKLVVYVYEDERIVDAEMTREPLGSASAEHEFIFKD